MTYQTLVDEVLSDAFPEDIAPNLEPIYRKRVLDGLIQLQQRVTQLKLRQWTFYEYKSTLYRQGLTSISKPPGKVKNVCVFNSRTLSDIVYYDPGTKEDLDRFTAQRASYQTYPDAVPYPTTGYFTPSSVLDKGFRTMRGIYVIDRDEIFLLPHIDSYERVLVEWSGSRTTWNNSDLLDFGKYNRQVVSCLTHYVKREAARNEDRSQTDYAAQDLAWRDFSSSLIIDCKDDVEPELPLNDIGILPRTFITEVVPVTSLGATIDDTAYFNGLWMLCTDNNKLYEVGPLLVDGQVNSDVSGEGLDLTASEVTFEAIRADNIWVKASDDNFYKLTVNLVDSNPVHGYEQVGSTGAGERITDDVSTVYIDVLCPENSTYYRLRLALVNGVPTLVPGDAPDNVTYPPITDQQGIIGVLPMIDAVTGNVVYIRIKDGVVSVKDS